MKIETFKQRFDFPIKLLKDLKMMITEGKNGKMYNISFDKNNLPIAKKII